MKEATTNNVTRGHRMKNLFGLITALVALMAMNGCTTITLIFGGSDSGPRPMTMGDAGVPPGDGGGIIPIGDAMVLDPDAGTDSGMTVTVDSGTGSTAVIVEPYGMRDSDIMIGDDGAVWQMASGYRFHAADGSIASLDASDIILDGDAADLNRVAVASDGLVYGAGTLASGFSSTRHIIFDAPIAADTDGYGYFQIWVQVARVQSSASVSGATSGVCNSGDRFRLGVYNVEYHLGSTVASTSFDTIYGNEFQVRQTRPTVTRQALSSTTLAGGIDQDLYRYQVSADSAGALELAAVAFEFWTTGSDVTLADFRVRKGSTDIAPADIRIVDELGNDLEMGSLNVPPGRAVRAIAIFSSEYVSGSGNAYTLHATTVGADIGDTLSVAFYRTESGATGYLLNDPTLSSLDTSAWGSPETGPVVGAGFIWSDLSEPHVNAPGSLGGSRDFIDGAHINALDEVTVLTR